jgi:hypothetical protein
MMVCFSERLDLVMAIPSCWRTDCVSNRSSSTPDRRAKQQCCLTGFCGTDSPSPSSFWSRALCFVTGTIVHAAAAEISDRSDLRQPVPRRMVPRRVDRQPKGLIRNSQLSYRANSILEEAMKGTCSFVIGLGIVLMASSATAQPPVVIVDQMQPVIDSSVGSLAIGGASHQRLAQLVTAGHDGRLETLFLAISCSSGHLVVDVRNVSGNQPGDVVLAHVVARAAEVPAIGAVFHSFDLHGSLSVAAGDRFAVVLDDPEGECTISQGPVGDTYAGGDGFFEALPNPPGWVPFSLFASARRDLPFLTVVRLR